MPSWQVQILFYHICFPWNDLDAEIYTTVKLHKVKTTGKMIKRESTKLYCNKAKRKQAPFER